MDSPLTLVSHISYGHLYTGWPLKSGCGYRHGIEVHIVFFYISELWTILSYRHPQEPHSQIRKVTVFVSGNHMHCFMDM